MHRSFLYILALMVLITCSTMFFLSCNKLEKERTYVPLSKTVFAQNYHGKYFNGLGDEMEISDKLITYKVIYQDSNRDPSSITPSNNIKTSSNKFAIHKDRKPSANSAFNQQSLKCILKLVYEIQQLFQMPKAKEMKGAKLNYQLKSLKDDGADSIIYVKVKDIIFGVQDASGRIDTAASDNLSFCKTNYENISKNTLSKDWEPLYGSSLYASSRSSYDKDSDKRIVLKHGVDNRITIIKLHKKYSDNSWQNNINKLLSKMYAVLYDAYEISFFKDKVPKDLANKTFVLLKDQIKNQLENIVSGINSERIKFEINPNSASFILYESQQANQHSYDNNCLVSNGPLTLELVNPTFYFPLSTTGHERISGYELHMRIEHITNYGCYSNKLKGKTALLWKWKIGEKQQSLIVVPIEYAQSNSNREVLLNTSFNVNEKK